MLRRRSLVEVSPFFLPCVSRLVPLLSDSEEVFIDVLFPSFV